MDFSKASLAELRQFTKDNGIKGCSGMKKAELAQFLIKYVEEHVTAVSVENKKNVSEPKTEHVVRETAGDTEYRKTRIVHHSEGSRGDDSRENNGQRRMRRMATYQDHSQNQERYQDRGQNQDRGQSQERYQDRVQSNQTAQNVNEYLPELDSGRQAHGILEVMPEGYGFIRSANYLPGDQDIYVSPAQIRRFGLKTGDIVTGNIRNKTQGEKFSALLYVASVNDEDPVVIAARKSFEEMTPIFPNERIELDGDGAPIPIRMINLLAPIGKGQRGMIVSPPKTGKTTLLKSILGLIPSLKGSCERGENLQLGYFEQEVKGDNKTTCIEELWQEFPSYTQYEIRSALAKCGLTTKHIESQVRVLSGGEQAKVRLCKLVNRDTNVLLLDEPTNHLDVDAKEALKSALKEYRGSILLICHEPEFYQDVVNEVWDMSKWTTKVF